MGYKNIHLIGGNVKQGNWDAIPTALSDDANELRLADQRLAARSAEAKQEAAAKAEAKRKLDARAAALAQRFADRGW
jgi:hypothetical protein|tara:strand:+ start:340 stop:570 length:231 start_codon:yes stop_codon:yes gene_type:complete